MPRGFSKPYFLGIESRSPAGVYLRQFLKIDGHYLPGPTFDIPDEVYCLCLGSGAAQTATNVKDFEESVGMVWNHPLSDSLVYVTYHPLYVQRKPSLLTTFKIHLDTFATMAKN